MKAAVFHGRRDVRIEDVDAPALTNDTDVLMDVLACGICGTDASEWSHGPLFAPLTTRHPASGHQGPIVLGHELLGRVTAVGSAVAGLRAGDRVVSGGGVWCGECRWCRAGRYNLCARWWVLGLDADGALAEQLVAPARVLVPVPDGMPDGTAVLAQPLAVAAHAVGRAGLFPGARVLVVGTGAIGSLVVAACAGQKPGLLAAMDVSGSQLTVARALGATHCLLASRTSASVEAEAAGLTGGEGFDVVIETSGVPSGLRTSLSLVVRGGTVLLVGLHEPPSQLDLHSLARREITLVTTLSQVNPVDVPAALDLLARFPIAETLVSRVVALEDLVPAGLAPLSAGELTGKAVVIPGG